MTGHVFVGDTIHMAIITEELIEIISGAEAL
jgi:F0F1-type ATP synthase gamma subunit